MFRILSLPMIGCELSHDDHLKHITRLQRDGRAEPLINHLKIKQMLLAPVRPYQHFLQKLFGRSTQLDQQWQNMCNEAQCMKEVLLIKNEKNNDVFNKIAQEITEIFNVYFSIDAEAAARCLDRLKNEIICPLYDQADETSKLSCFDMLRVLSKKQPVNEETQKEMPEKEIPNFVNQLLACEAIWLDDIFLLPPRVIEFILFEQLLKRIEIEAEVSASYEVGEFNSEKFDSEITSRLQESNEIINREFEEALIRAYIMHEALSNFVEGNPSSWGEPKGGTFSKVYFLENGYCIKPLGFNEDVGYLAYLMDSCKGSEDDFSHVIGRNVAANQVSKLLFPDKNLIVNTIPIRFSDENENKHFGILMDKANGHTIGDLSKLKDKKLLFNILKDGNFRLNLVTLQFLDSLLGSIDRNPENYFVELNGSNSVLGVKGVDNDQCLASGDLYEYAQYLADAWKNNSSSHSSVIQLPPIIPTSVAEIFCFGKELRDLLASAINPNAIAKWQGQYEDELIKKLNSLIGVTLGYISTDEIQAMLERFLDISQFIRTGICESTILLVDDNDMDSWSSMECFQKLIMDDNLESYPEVQLLRENFDIVETNLQHLSRAQPLASVFGVKPERRVRLVSSFDQVCRLFFEEQLNEDEFKRGLAITLYGEDYIGE